MASKRKKPEAQQEEGAPAWMNTYGDMVTLVLTFFVLLFSFSEIDAQKWEEIVNSFSGQRIAIMQPLDPGQPQPGEFDVTISDPPENSPETSETASAGSSESLLSKAQFDELFEMIKENIRYNKLEAKLSVAKENDVIILRITDSALFDSGRDIIKPDAKKMLANVIQIISKYNKIIKQIIVEGHTDNVPINSAAFSSNWELSACRAVNVVEYILDISKIDPSKFHPAGNGEFQPIADNNTEQGKAKNRRVDFVIESIEKID